MRQTATALLILSLLGACAVAPPKWQATNYHDEFTEAKICRVEYGTANQRQFGRTLSGTYFAHNFYAENNNGQIRAGVRSEPAIPIGGDIQIKVGSKLYTLTSSDTPLDVTPAMPTPQGSEQFNNDYKNMVTNIQQLSSPYRAYTGQKAKALIKDLVQTGGEVKFRVVGVNTALSKTGTFMVDENFKTALKECGVIE